MVVTECVTGRHPFTQMAAIQIIAVKGFTKFLLIPFQHLRKTIILK
jgi:hypothetical protein